MTKKTNNREAQILLKFYYTTIQDLQTFMRAMIPGSDWTEEKLREHYYAHVGMCHFERRTEKGPQ